VTSLVIYFQVRPGPCPREECLKSTTLWYTPAFWLDWKVLPEEKPSSLFNLLFSDMEKQFRKLITGVTFIFLSWALSKKPKN
jgi:hypothetical protein